MTGDAIDLDTKDKDGNLTKQSGHPVPPPEAGVARKDEDVNLTKRFGLVQQLSEEGWNRIWKPLTGRQKSTVFVFDKINNRLLYKLDSHSRVSIWSRLIDPMLGIKYKAFAVSNQSRTFSFEDEFVFGDTKIPHVMLEARIYITQPEDVAVSVVEGGDPVSELRNSIKAYLDVAFKETRLGTLDSLQAFVDQMHSTVRNAKVTHPYLGLEGITAQLELPKAIQEAIEKRNEERIKHEEAVASKEHEYVQKEKDYQIKELEQRKQFELVEYELAQLGITGVQARLLMRDPQKRAEYLAQIYKQQMALIEQGNKQNQDLLDMRLDTIKQYRDKVMSEHSGLSDLIQLLKLIGETTATFPGISISEVVGADITQAAFPQKTSGDDAKETRQIENRKSPTRQGTEGALAAPSSESAPEKDTGTQEAPPAPKQKRRQRRSAVGAVDETDEGEGTNIIKQDKTNRTPEMEGKADTDNSGDASMA